MQSIYLSLLYVLAFVGGAASENSDYNEFSVCSDSSILVEDISVLCDTPGSYYYGSSSKYRNSATCQAGDKAHLYVQVEIIQDLEVADAYLTVGVEGYGTVESVSVFDSASFCNNVAALDGQNCPQPGLYEISKAFYWGSQNDNYEYKWKPKVSIGMKSNANNRNYDLGGANTNKCSGDMFSKWSEGLNKAAANTISTFLLTFGILTGSILAICLFCFCMCRRAKRNRIAEEEKEVSNEYHKMSMVGRNANLVEF